MQDHPLRFTRNVRGWLFYLWPPAGLDWISKAICIVLICAVCVGCRRTAPMHVWQPARVPAPTAAAKIALSPIAGNHILSQRLQNHLLAQRPLASADVALFTPEQLLQSSPVRLASTAPLTSDLTAIQAARAAGAELLVQGQIMAAKVDLSEPQADKPAESSNMNQAFFQRLQKKKNQKRESILVSWRVIDVGSARTLGHHSFTFFTGDVPKKYPDLEAQYENQTEMLLAGCARESWKTIAPYVDKDHVRLAVPWIQPGAFTVRRGVSAARKGQWQLAETYWQRAAGWPWLTPAAHHNLALAYAAREDFSAAKQQLQHATGPFAVRLPSETLMWLDQQHRNYNTAHGLGRPPEGWAFPDPMDSEYTEPVQAIDLEMLPWWTAIPLTKPPGWTWQGWLTQPWPM